MSDTLLKQKQLVVVRYFADQLMLKHVKYVVKLAFRSREWKVFGFLCVFSFDWKLFLIPQKRGMYAKVKLCKCCFSTRLFIIVLTWELNEPHLHVLNKGERMMMQSISISLKTVKLGVFLWNWKLFVLKTFMGMREVVSLDLLCNSQQ